MYGKVYISWKLNISPFRILSRARGAGSPSIHQTSIIMQEIEGYQNHMTKNHSKMYGKVYISWKLNISPFRKYIHFPVPLWKWYGF